MDKADITLDGLLKLCNNAGYEDLALRIIELKQLKLDGVIDLEKIGEIDKEVKERIIELIDKRLFTIVE